jgi:diguanylate cyclase (GGDEF)-like protein/PAS domain S-box-containing protein
MKATRERSLDFESFFDLSNDLFAVVGPDGSFREVNAPFQRILGWRRSDLTGRGFMEFVHPEDVEPTTDQIREIVPGRPARSVETRYRCADGEYRDLLWTVHLPAETSGLHYVGRDLTESKRAREGFNAAIDLSTSPMILVDSRGTIVLLNKATEALFGYPKDELMGKSVEFLIPERLRSRHSRYREEFMHTASFRPMGANRELIGLSRDGREVPLEIGLSPIQTEDGHFVLAAIEDQTDRILAQKLSKQAEKTTLDQSRELERLNRKLTKLATTDDLTGLKNRRVLIEQLESLLGIALRTHRPISLLLIDVDHFKDYNDSYGHLEGDRVLETLGSLLLKTARRSDSAARYGGEEFAILLPDNDPGSAVTFGERLRSLIEEYPWPHRDVTVSMGIGTLQFRAEETWEETDWVAALISLADRALYESKRAGRNRVTHSRSLDEE